MLYTVLVHKSSRRRGAVMPAEEAKKWKWGPGEVENFEFVDIDLAPGEVDDVRMERKVIRTDGTLVAVPESEWPENKMNLAAVTEMVRTLERRFGTASTKKLLLSVLGSETD